MCFRVSIGGFDAWWNNGRVFLDGFQCAFGRTEMMGQGRMTSRFVKLPWDTANELFNRLSGLRDTPEHNELADTFTS